MEAKRGRSPSPLGGSTAGDAGSGGPPASPSGASFVVGCLVDLGQADRRRWQLLGLVGDRDRRALGALDAELGEIHLVHGRDTLLGAADRGVARGAAVDLATRRIAVTGPDELVDDDRPSTGGAARGVELLDVLPQRHVDAPRAGELREGRVEHGRVRRVEEGDRGQLAERAGIGGDGAHPVADGAPRDGAGAGPRVEDGVACGGEGRQLGVEDVIGR